MYFGPNQVVHRPAHEPCVSWCLLWWWCVCPLPQTPQVCMPLPQTPQQQTPPAQLFWFIEPCVYQCLLWWWCVCPIPHAPQQQTPSYFRVKVDCYVFQLSFHLVKAITDSWEICSFRSGQKATRCILHRCVFFTSTVWIAHWYIVYRTYVQYHIVWMYNTSL